MLLPLLLIAVCAAMFFVGLKLGESRGRVGQLRMSYLYQQKSEILNHYWRTGQRYPTNIITRLDSLIAEEK